MENPDVERKVIKSLRFVLEKCEETGRFSFGSRRYFEVGEWLFAFEGLFRFVEGNSEFKAQLEPHYSFLFEYFKEELVQPRLPPSPWE